MADPDERDTEGSGPHTQRNPGAEQAAPPPAVSHARPNLPGEAPASDTLLSAPGPATAEELALDQRLSACERRIEELELRLGAVERRPASSGVQPDRSYWIWLVFLAGLALAWQILTFLK